MKNEIDKRFLGKLMLEQLKNEHIAKKQKEIELLRKRLHYLEEELAAITTKEGD